MVPISHLLSFLSCFRWECRWNSQCFPEGLSTTLSRTSSRTFLLNNCCSQIEIINKILSFWFALWIYILSYIFMCAYLYNLLSHPRWVLHWLALFETLRFSQWAPLLPAAIKCLSYSHECNTSVWFCKQINHSVYTPLLHCSLPMLKTITPC